MEIPGEEDGWRRYGWVLVEAQLEAGDAAEPTLRICTPLLSPNRKN